MDKIVTKVRGGVLRCYKSADPDNPGLTITYQPEGASFEIDILMVENTQMELRGNEVNPEPGDLRCLVWADVNHEDYTDRFDIKDSDIRAMVKREENQ